MRRHCQFTVKRSEERVGLTVAAEQQTCGILEYCQELADLTKMDSPPASHKKCTFCKDFDKNGLAKATAGDKHFADESPT
jgi:hypothetical protein